jgi:hypothetical protein
MILFFLVLSLPMFAFSTLMDQPYLLSRGFSVTTLGFAFGLIHGLSGTLSAFSHVLERRLGERGSFVLISVLYTALFILAGLMLGKAAIGLVVLLYIISNYHGVIVNSYINHHLESETRATVLSMQSFLNNTAVMVLSVAIGYLIDRYAMNAVLIGLGLAVGAISLPFLLGRYAKGRRPNSLAPGPP